MNESIERVYERVLVLRCQTGDEAAFEEIVRAYHPRLRNFVRRMLDDDHAADDLLQEIWFDVFRNIGRLCELGAFRAWLYRIARDRVYRLLRRKGVPTQPLDDVEIVAAVNEEPIDVSALHESLRHLPPAQREVLLLRFSDELSYEQIATAVGCDVGTVRSRLHYAKSALRRSIERNSS